MYFSCSLLLWIANVRHRLQPILRVCGVFAFDRRALNARVSLGLNRELLFASESPSPHFSFLAPVLDQCSQRVLVCAPLNRCPGGFDDSKQLIALRRFSSLTDREIFVYPILNWVPKLFGKHFCIRLISMLHRTSSCVICVRMMTCVLY